MSGKARPLSIAANLMMGSLTTTQSVSWRGEIQTFRINTAQNMHFDLISQLARGQRRVGLGSEEPATFKAQSQNDIPVKMLP